MKFGYLPINDFDVAGITNEVNNALSSGLYAKHELAERAKGKAKYIYENPYAPPLFVIFNIHKFGKKRVLGTKVFWVIQLISADTKSGPFILHGCVAARTLAGTITEAYKDVKWGFMSRVDLQLAIDAMVE